MPETEEIVINTGPLLALVAATSDLTLLRMYRRVWVPFEVCQEVLAGGSHGFAVSEFTAADWLHKTVVARKITPFLANSLDRGEAAVIQLALDENVPTVCIDEAAGRRIARLSGLLVTGSIGILLRAQREGHTLVMREAIQQMQTQGVWLSEPVIQFALREAGELEE